MKQRIIISLTTLPSRIGLIGKTLESIKNQTIRFDDIYLNLPEKCLKEDAPYNIPDYISNDNNIIINRCKEDFGTCTKFFPILNIENDPNTIILVADDDIIYGPTWYEKLVHGIMNNPNTMIGTVGWSPSKLYETGGYDFTLGYGHSRKSVIKSDDLVLEHYAGVAYKRSFFNDDVFKLFNRVKFLYQQANFKNILPLDDITISGYMNRNKIKKGIVGVEDSRIVENKIGINSIKGEEMKEKNLALIKIFQSQNIFLNEHQIKQKILLSCLDFKVNKTYYTHDTLNGEENFNRNRPRPYMDKIVELMKIFNGQTVVEIGTMRSIPNTIDGEIDGTSTQIWTDAGLDIHTCDIDPKCKEFIEQYYSNNIPKNLNVSTMDGIEFLENFKKPIDLLFLDGWDKGTSLYAEKHLEAYQVCKNNLSPLHLICIDDTDFNTSDGGKDNILSPVLINDGYIKIIDGRQTVFLKYTSDNY